jgi:hypothetical protein
MKTRRNSSSESAGKSAFLSVVAAWGWLGANQSRRASGQPIGDETATDPAMLLEAL